jgi:hypothetical protein
MNNTEITIQIYSDIYIENMKDFPRIIPNAKYLFLVGNICKLNSNHFFNFLDYCSLTWEKTFYTPGNNEFYSEKKNYDTLNFEYELRTKERYKNVFYLNNNCVPLNDEIYVYGSVFWITPPLSRDIYINDYKGIKQFSDKKKYNIHSDYNFIKKLSDEHLSNLNIFLNKNTKKVIIMTHFPPTQEDTINIKYTPLNQESKNCLAWNNILDFLNLNNVILWISGHTHFSYDFIKNNIRLISNQLGYKHEIGNTKLSEKGLFII